MYSASGIPCKKQKPHQIIDINQWFLGEDQDFTIYPEGKREKNLLTSPSEKAYYSNLQQNDLQQNKLQRYEFIKPSWHYLFKRSRNVYPEQYWMEIFAYQFGCLIGVCVPPAFAAINQKTNDTGTLIEWFYEPYELTETIEEPKIVKSEIKIITKEKFISGGDILQAKMLDFERKRGRQHNFETIIEALEDKIYHLKEGWKNEVVKMLTFDALLGNTDRHQDNWGIVIENLSTAMQTNDINKLSSRLAPAFDNGTSMGHEIRENNFKKFRDPIYMQKYVERGKPHIKWNLEENHETRGNHQKLLQQIIQKFPEMKSLILGCLQFDKTPIENILESLLEFEVADKISQQRADFMLNLLMYRRDQLLSIFG